MGLFDTLVDGDKSVQVKCWDSLMDTYRVGDNVPTLGPYITYTIVLPSYEEARFARIGNGVFKGLTDEPSQTWSPYISKWGGETIISVDQDELNPIAQVISEFTTNHDKEVET